MERIFTEERGAKLITACEEGKTAGLWERVPPTLHCGCLIDEGAVEHAFASEHTYHTKVVIVNKLSAVFRVCNIQKYSNSGSRVTIRALVRFPKKQSSRALYVSPAKLFNSLFLTLYKDP